MERAGWHIAHKLNWPNTITPLHLLPYSPELNPIERVWLYLRERCLSHRVFDTYEAIMDACCDAWKALLAEQGASPPSAAACKASNLQGTGINDALSRQAL